MRKICVKLGLILLVMLCASGCFVDMLRQESHETLLGSDKEWYVYKIVLGDGQEFTPKWENAKSTLIFSVGENRIFGISACNNYSATFLLKGKKMNVSSIDWSRRICYPEESMKYEYWFLKNLEGNFVVKRSGKELVLESERAVYYLR